MTNREMIQSMTDRELAVFLCEFDVCVLCPRNKRRICYATDCDETGLIEEWLNSESEEK